MNLFKKEKMKVFVMDKKFETLKEYESILTKLFPKINFSYYTHYIELEKAIQEDVPDTVIVDGDDVRWTIASKKMKDFNNKIKIIVSSMNDKNALLAMQMNLNGYLKKPFNEEEVRKLMSNLK